MPKRARLWSRLGGVLFLLLGGVFAALGYSHPLLADAPLGFPDLSGVVVPWAVIAAIVAAALTIARSRTVLLIAAVFGFASGLYWLFQIPDVAHFSASMVVLVVAISLAASLVTLSAWLLAGLTGVEPRK
jgi:hypothetical protein